MSDDRPYLIGRDAGQRGQPNRQGHRQRNTGQTVERQQVVGRDRTIVVAEDRSSPMATSRRRSALAEAWVSGAVVMSFLAALGL